MWLNRGCSKASVLGSDPFGQRWLKLAAIPRLGLAGRDGSHIRRRPHHVPRRVAPALLAIVAMLGPSCSSGGTPGGALRPPVSLYLLPDPASLPAGVQLWEAQMFPAETELTFFNRSACNGGTEIRLSVIGTPPGVAPRPYSPPGTFSNGGGTCDYAAGPQPSDAVGSYQGNNLSWSGPAGIASANGSIDRPTLTRFVRGLRAVSKSQWIAVARQAPHRQSQDGVLGPNT